MSTAILFIWLHNMQKWHYLDDPSWQKTWFKAFFYVLGKGAEIHFLIVKFQKMKAPAIGGGVIHPVNHDG